MTVPTGGFSASAAAPETATAAVAMDAAATRTAVHTDRRWAAAGRGRRAGEPGVAAMAPRQERTGRGSGEGRAPQGRDNEVEEGGGPPRPAEAEATTGWW